MTCVARDSGSLTVKEDAPLESVLGNEALRRLGALIATDADGHISGVLTLDAIGRAVQAADARRRQSQRRDAAPRASRFIGSVRAGP